MAQPTTHVRFSALLLLTGLSTWSLWTTELRAESAELSQPAASVTLYDTDPNHLWNRLHSHLFVRTNGQNELVGTDEVDPLLWHDTTHLLEGPSFDLAIELLNEFTTGDGHRSINDPLKRVVLQHDLWSVFDWLAINVAQSRRELNTTRTLRRLIAAAINKLALTNEQIAQLPVTWNDAVESGEFPPQFNSNAPDQPFLPPDLLDDNGPWVCLARSGPDRITARLHARLLGARSVFLVFIRLPGPDRQSTLKYLTTLNLFKRPIVLKKNPIGHIVSGSNRTPVRGDPIEVNPDLPQFPAGTQVLLLRTMLLINNQAQIVPTGIVEMVQSRVYHEVNEGTTETWRDAPMQAFHEIRFQRARLLNGQSGGLAPVALEEPQYQHFFARGEQHQFEHGPRPLTCIGCHRGNGVHSINTYAFGHGLSENLAPKLSPTRRDSEASRTIKSKQQRYEWGLLRGLWDLDVVNSGD